MKSDCRVMMVNYMTTHIESVKLSRDFVVIQHFRFCKLFCKHVSRCFLHRYTTGCAEKRHIYTMSTALSIVRVGISTR